MTDVAELLRRSIEGQKPKKVARGAVGPSPKSLVQIEIRGGELLKNMENRTSDFRTPFRRIVRGGRQMVVEEFRAESFRGPRGGFTRWPKTKPFGNRPAPQRTLHRSGRLERAWGGGAGSVTSVTSAGAKWGVSVPYAGFVRSGARIGVTRKMRMFLGLSFGVWLSPSKSVIVIPARRHAELGNNVAFKKDAGLIIAAHMTGATRGEIAQVTGQVIR